MAFSSAIFILLLFIVAVQSILTHSTKYQISSIQVPIVVDEKRTNQCKQHTFNIESISFIDLNELNIPTMIRQIDPYAFRKYNYTVFDMKKSIHFSPTTLLNEITIDIQPNNNHHYICSPAYLLLPIIGNDIKLKCIMNEWNAITNSISYDCNPSTVIPSTPSTTIFYSMDSEYKQAIKEYKEQKRRLYENATNADRAIKSDLSASDNQQRHYFGIMKPLPFWIIISSLIICTLITACVATVVCFKKRKNKKKKMTNDAGKDLEQKNKYSPVSTNDFFTETNLDNHNIIEMADMVHQIAKCDSTSSSGSSHSDFEKTKSLQIQITEPQNVKQTETVSFMFGNIKTRKHRVNTDSFDIESTLNTPHRSLDLLSNRSGYSVDYEEDEDVDDNVLVLSPAGSQLSVLSNQYMKVLPDDDEDNEEHNNNDCDFYRKCFSLNAIDDFECIRRHSGDIDYDKMDKLYKNSLGTSLPLHENGIQELKKKHQFFYRAPSVTKIKKKKQRFKHRIREDSMSGKDLIDDVINQMITDSEISDNVMHSQQSISNIIKC